MANCPRCAAFVKDGQKFCARCGANLAELLKPKIPPELAARIDICEKRIAHDPLSVALYVDLGDAYYENKLYEEALVQYQKAAAVDKSSTEAHLKSGNVYLASGKPDRARECYREVLALKSDSLEAKTGLFVALKELHLTAKATALGREILTTAPDTMDVRRGLKDLLLAQGKDDEALPELEALAAAAPSDPSTLLQLGELHSRRGDEEKALARFQQALALTPEAPDLQLRVGRLLSRAGQYADAIPHLELAAAMEPANLPGIVLLAQALVHESRFDDAAKAADVITPASYTVLGQEERKGLHNVYAVIGERALASGKPSESAGWLESAMAVHRTPETEKALAKAYAAHGRLALENGKLTEAEQLLAKAMSLDSTNADCTDTLARVRTRRRQRRRSLALQALSAAALAVIIAAFWFVSHGRVMIVLSPKEEASVTLDDRPVPREPGRPGAYVSSSLFFGKYRVVVQKDGFEPWQAMATTGWGRTTRVEAALVPIYGSLRLQSVPSGADVTLDGRFWGKTPLSVDTILATRHEVQLARAGWLADTSELMIPARDTLNRCIQLSRVFRDVTISALDAPGAYFNWECKYFIQRTTDMIDGDPATFVTVGVLSRADPDHQASLHWVTLTLPEERYVTAIGLANSNEALRRSALFELRSVHILFSDGSSQMMDLQSCSDMQHCSVVPPKRTSQITIKPCGLRRGGGNTYMFGIAEIEVQGYGDEGDSRAQGSSGDAKLIPRAAKAIPGKAVKALGGGSVMEFRNRDADGYNVVVNGVTINPGSKATISCLRGQAMIYWPAIDSTEYISVVPTAPFYNVYLHRKMW